MVWAATPARAAAQVQARGPARAQALARKLAQARAAEKTAERVATKVAMEVATMVLSTPKAVRLVRTTANEAVRTAEWKRKTAAVMTAMAI